MSGKRYTKQDKKNKTKYYNSQLLDEIDYKIISGETETAYRLVNEYIEKYPNDELGNLFFGRVLASMGRHEEAKNIINSSFFELTYHNHRANMMASYLASGIYFECGEVERAIEIIKRAIDVDEKLSNGDPDSKIRVMYINICIDTGRYEEGLKIIEQFSKVSDRKLLVLKEAMIYNILGQYKKTIDVLNIFNDDIHSLFSQQKYYLLADAYYGLFQIDHSNTDCFNRAEEYFIKSLSMKNEKYYMALSKLGFIATSKGDLVQAMKYANQLLDNIDIFGNSLHKRDAVYKLLFRINLKKGDYEECEKNINKMELQITRDSQRVLFLFKTKRFQECIDSLNYLLSNTTNASLSGFLQLYIECYIRLGKYDEARYKLECIKDSLSKPEYERFTALLNNYTNQEHGIYRCYSSKQIANYSRKRAIAHILEGHLEDEEEMATFKDVESVEKAFDYAEQELAKGYLDYEPEDIFDKYEIPISGVAFDKYGDVKSIAAIVIPNTKEIITLYPIIAIRNSYIEEYKGKQVKRLSQTEKFNKRYGKQ